MLSTGAIVLVVDAVIPGFLVIHLFDLVVPPVEAAEETRLVAEVDEAPTVETSLPSVAQMVLAVRIR